MENVVTSSVSPDLDTGVAMRIEEEDDKLSLDIFNQQAADLKAYMEGMKIRRAELDQNALLVVQEDIQKSLSMAGVTFDKTLSFIEDMNRRSVSNCEHVEDIEVIHTQSGERYSKEPISSLCDNVPITSMPGGTDGEEEEGDVVTCPIPPATNQETQYIVPPPTHALSHNETDDYFNDDEEDEEDPYSSGQLMRGVERKEFQQVIYINVKPVG